MINEPVEWLTSLHPPANFTITLEFNLAIARGHNLIAYISKVPDSNVYVLKPTMRWEDMLLAVSSHEEDLYEIAVRYGIPVADTPYDDLTFVRPL